ncbi:hypothetical protein CGZ93_02715 [Enemella dayhoffiae]|uniref:Uncharacterized protein n=1 Tax=Enemella dayhoffiae TaxID=2016507 RepID=A0A255HAE3_9ACTN|nr:hypothetical protein [Enemella dayhoffiae]OYO24631.1 hypothetical protein CGZ93_02715 [Enemella dayhoffiae]
MTTLQTPAAPAAASRKPLANRLWLKILLVLLVLIPPIARNLPLGETSNAIQQVIMAPVAESVETLRITFKWMLFATIPFAFWPRFSGSVRARTVLGYYAVALVVVAIGQNWGTQTAWGSVFLLGNALIQLVVVGFLVRDVVAGLSRFDSPRRDRMWLLVPMLFAWLWPYTVRDGAAVAAFNEQVLVNGAGVAYCLTTPVVLGLMLIFADSVHRPTLAVAGWAGSIFGVLNMMTWFLLNPASWWMGVCHVPLLVISVWAAWEGRYRRHRKPAAAPVNPI